ncbi:MAG: AAA family ATPase [Solirubrobacterales bacterium]|nr:AAA family ATPase [Solirubrobacterales bacterium]
MSNIDLVERADELAAIGVALERSLCGEGRLVLVEGPAGVGKSALLAAAAARARDLGVETMFARAGEYERGLPFEVVRQLFERSLARARDRRRRAFSGAAAPAAALLGGVAAESTQTAPIEARHALYWLVANLAAEKPLALIIDDLQWADPSSQEWLLYLTRRLGDISVAVLASWRTKAATTSTDLIDRMRDEPVTVRLIPRALTAEAVAAIVHAAVCPEPDAALCEAAYRLSAGNPFLLQELLRALPADGPRTATEIERARPQSVARGINRRMAGLSDAARALGDAVAILGDGSELRHGAALAGLDEREAIAAADELTAAGVLSAGRPLRVEHPLVRSALHDAQPLQARDRAHLDAARLLAAEGVATERVASHLLLAPERADPWVAEQLESAGVRALRHGAPAEAADLLERALAEPPPAQRRGGLLAALGRAEHHLLRRSARVHLEEAISIAVDPTAAAVAARTLAAELLAERDFLASEQVLIDAAARVEHEDREQYLRLLAQLGAGLSIGFSDNEQTRRALDRSSPDLTGSTHGERLLLAVTAFRHLILDATAEQAIGLAERAVGDGELFSVGEVDWPIVQALMVLIACDQLSSARAAIDAGLAQADRIGSLVARVPFCYLRCGAGWLAGDLAESEADGRIALALARDTPGLLPTASAYLARTLVDRGLTDEAESVLSQGGPGPPGGNLYWSVLARVREAQGQYAAAAAAALELADLPIAQRGMSCTIPWRLQAAVALSATGDRANARELLAEQRPLTARWGLPRALAAFQRAEGLVEESTDQLERAVATLDGTPARLECARTLIDLGAMRRRHKQRAAGRQQLRAGLDLAHRCAAEGLVTRAAEELAACGARPRNLLLTGVDSLTATERRIARLAADGNSNPEIAQRLYVSRKTVESHLGSIYRKLDIGSREQLEQALVRSNTVAGSTD